VRDLDADPLLYAFLLGAALGLACGALFMAWVIRPVVCL
jgi:hypothetical protein